MRSSPSRRSELERLGAVPFAHRGLHGGDLVENSGGAIAAAADRGYGVELDVQLSRDGEAMVFHDYELDRLTGERGAVSMLTAAQLQAIRLDLCNEPLPRLADALSIVGGRTPLLVEVKSRDRRAARLCQAVARALRGYRGPVGVMSFNPEVGAWFARHSEGVLRGLVVTESGRRGPRGRIERPLALWRARADFLAYDIRDLPSPFAGAARRRGLPVYTWTVRSAADRARAAAHADQIIFEAPAA
ncbi:MAG TPA: glycerophosphodiester phosphodiesterase family protein [Allosphingosinicella sp.]|jgi:glycerophosphoryl diester phosphodiesterase|nr:glycerophosphodiester phosphodiesterase family protein [Allosphingosinicella sp.]